MSRQKMLARALIVFALLGACGTGARLAAAGEFVAEARTIAELKAVFGQVESRTVVPARARIGGTIREIGISEGREVKEGEVIARVVDDKLTFELNAADAKIAALQSQLDNARTEFDRAQQLLARGIASQSRLDQAKTQFDVIVSQVAAAQADKAVIEQRTREGAILAPATGRVLTVPVTLGSVVLAGEEIARIASGQYYLRLSLPERHATEIKEGGTVLIGQRGLSPVASGGSAAARQARIAKVYPEIADGRVIADVEVADIGDYFVNERTLVWIPVGERKVIAIPPAAVTTRHGVDYVRVATPDGPLDVAVVLGETFQDGDGPRLEILTGLRPGDRIVMPDVAP
ncbi:efflux RND transporter periplasmic adaptor subunit [Chelatococcus asaccharovorans]|uniref:efflux RND transporter periplasmic adaptor subunit n=1 Tax=Chelatococcus asaccharovorans TaxID=28210 RepID=UPI00224C716D|nr:efflux RND transporter periplasmic adaptor subunit [Chelatococcus asaccharovorans]CAH1673456.1 putative RND efflux membrane fusion protein [Chelatococcus asaccharovorans]CAH1675124.1 putative RND efflux membrane fusion protein [Chelatococcus asaccharovorans]